jgi:hypothetical protein
LIAGFFRDLSRERASGVDPVRSGAFAAELSTMALAFCPQWIVEFEARALEPGNGSSVGVVLASVVIIGVIARAKLK